MSSITFILLTNKTERKKGTLHKPELRGIMKFIDNNLWYNPIPEAGFDSGNTALLYLRRRYKIEAKKLELSFYYVILFDVWLQIRLLGAIHLENVYCRSLSEPVVGFVMVLHLNCDWLWILSSFVVLRFLNVDIWTAFRLTLVFCLRK